MDKLGDHAVHCSSEIGIKFRHNLIQDILMNICCKVGISDCKEAPMGFSSEAGKDLMPSNLLLFTWIHGKNDVCVNVTGGSSFADTGVSS